MFVQVTNHWRVNQLCTTTVIVMLRNISGEEGRGERGEGRGERGEGWGVRGEGWGVRGQEGIGWTIQFYCCQFKKMNEATKHLLITNSSVVSGEGEGGGLAPRRPGGVLHNPKRVHYFCFCHYPSTTCPHCPPCSPPAPPSFPPSLFWYLQWWCHSDRGGGACCWGRWGGWSCSPSPTPPWGYPRGPQDLTLFN